MRTLMAVAALCASGICHAQEYWQGTAYGDSVKQVQLKVPGVSAPETSDQMRNNGIEQMMFVPTQIAGRTFEANFYFSKTGLDRVILISDSLLSEPKANAMHNVIIEAMKIKYGNLVEAADPAKAVIDERPFWMLWKSGDTDILVVPQHHANKLMVSYNLSDRQKEIESSRAAKAYLKKANPKAVAEKL